MAEMNICDGTTHKTSKVTLITAEYRIAQHKANFATSYTKDYCRECFAAVLSTYQTGGMNTDNSYLLERL